MKKLKIVTVCQFGMGTTILMKTLIEEICKEENIPAEVIPENINGVWGRLDADLIVTNETLVDQLKRMGKPVVGIRDFVDKEDAKRRLWKVLKQMGYSKEG